MSLKKKTWKRIVTALLAITLLATNCEMDLLAAPVQTEVTESADVKEGREKNAESSGITVDTLSAVEDEGQTEEEPQILEEMETERTENQKTFRLDNGAYLVAQYADPVHYQDEDKQWQEADYSLEQTGTGTSEEGYETTKKSGKKERIKFSKKAKDGQTVSIKQTEYPLSWGFTDTAKSAVEIEETEDLKISNHNEQFLVVDNKSQTVTYPDIYEQVDVQYQIMSDGIKEDLILKGAGAKSEYEVLYDIGKLSAVQKDEQTISLMDGEEVIYQIQAPYMVDANGERSEEVSLAITEEKNKKLTVTLQAEEAWLQDEDREYPVVLDPIVLTKTTRDAIDSTFIASGRASENFSGKKEMLVGRESSAYQNCRTLVKFVLPTLKKGNMVVDAKLNMCMYDYDFYSSTTPDLQINAHRITSGWTLGNVTWNNKPTIDSTVLDYDYIIRAQKWATFNVTEAVKAWYEGTAENHGIMIKSYNEDGTNAQVGVKGYFWPERYNDVDERFPILQIEYRNNKGLEDYWSYTTLSAGIAGTAYINDYTGNLVFVHEDTSTTGNLVPATIQHVYNGYQAGERYTGNRLATGKGWKLNLQQTVKPTSSYNFTSAMQEIYPYAYEDGDGTVHFFYKKTENNKTKYYDEDGLGLELKMQDGIATITDKDHNTMTFTPTGNLRSIKDKSGNKMVVSYDTDENGYKTIYKVVDGAGHEISLANNETDYHYLTLIQDPEDRETQYTYQTITAGAGYLTQITYPDGTHSSYIYDSEGALTEARSPDGTGLRFSYTSAAKGKRVSRVEEIGIVDDIGQIVAFDRSEYNTTVIRTSGPDDEFNNNDDFITTLQFDNYGRTVGRTAKTANKIHYGSEILTYTDGTVNEEASNIKQLNRISDQSYASKNIVNYLKNHSGEMDLEWSNDFWMSSDGNYIGNYTNNVKYFGQRSLMIQQLSMNGDGAGCHYQRLDDSVVSPGNTYTFSAYVKTSNVQKSHELDTGYGACLAIRFNHADGSIERQYSEYITGTTQSSFNNGWQRINMQFTVPEDATATRAYLMVRNAIGTAYFDGMQIEKGENMNAYNMLENSSFDVVTNGVPDEWTFYNRNSSKDTYSTSYYFNGGGSAKISGEASKAKYIYQEVPVSGTEKDIYIVSAWAKASAVPYKGDEERHFDIFMRVYYADGTSVLKSKRAKFNRDYNGWQRASAAVNLKDADADTNRIPKKVRIGLRYNYQANTVYFDNAQLVKDVAGSYTYDKEGNIITTEENGKQSSAMVYDDASHLTSLTDAENNLYEYEYDDNHRVTEAKSPMGQKVLFDYEDKGLVTTTKIQSSDEEQQIVYGTDYTAASGNIVAGAYVQKEMDEDGRETAYDYDLQSGRLNSVTTPDGSITSYTYNENTDQLTGVSSSDSSGLNVSSVSYEYNDLTKRLESISHNGFEYEFEYDQFGNTTKTTVAGQELIENEYALYNGKLKKSTYGNGDIREYFYDEGGNLSSVKENNTPASKWDYDAAGKLMSYTDLLNYQKYLYEYDVTGKLIATKVMDETVEATEQNAKKYTAQYNYNALNLLEKERLGFGSHSFTSTYEYNENQQLQLLTFNADRKVQYAYDTLGRLAGKELSITIPLKYNYSYYSSERDDEGSITCETTKLKEELIGDTGYVYEYDAMGNIIKVSQGTRTEDSASVSEPVTKITYKYDSKNQLVRENNLYLNRTIVYTYDSGGNLTFKKEYAYTESENESDLIPVRTIPYVYDDSDGVWKDKLVSYNNVDIEYDEIGNPKEYRGKTMTWKGRQLQSIRQDNADITYGYNSDGLRVKKTNGQEVSEYYYSNGHLSYEKRGDKELIYTYDFEGNLVRIRYINGESDETYYPAVNSRGDVEAIYHYTGERVAKYTYDSWGKVLSVVDASGNEITNTSHVGLVNPIRYRGYYYDVESGFYYVSSRYYDPEVGRWLNADGYITTGQGPLSYNMFAYCGNNPVNRTDLTGTKWFESFCKTVKKGWNKVKTWVKNTLGVNNKTTATYRIINTGKFIKVRGGAKVTATTNNKKKRYIPITIYSSMEEITPGIDEASGGGIEFGNLNFYMGTDGIKGSISSGFLMCQTSHTYSVTSDGLWEYELSENLCWDNYEYTTYMSISTDYMLVATAGVYAAVAMVAGPYISVVIPALATNKR